MQDIQAWALILSVPGSRPQLCERRRRFLDKEEAAPATPPCQRDAMANVAHIREGWLPVHPLLESIGDSEKTLHALPDLSQADSDSHELNMFFRGRGIGVSDECLCNPKLGKLAALTCIQSFFDSCIGSTYIICYLGPGKQGSGNWCCGSDAVSLDDVLHLWAQKCFGDSSSVLFLYLDSCYSGRWCEALLRSGFDNVAIQTSCSHDERAIDGKFTPEWIKEQTATWTSLMKEQAPRKQRQLKMSPLFYQGVASLSLGDDCLVYVGTDFLVGTDSLIRVGTEYLRSLLSKDEETIKREVENGDLLLLRRLMRIASLQRNHSPDMWARLRPFLESRIQEFAYKDKERIRRHRITEDHHRNTDCCASVCMDFRLLIAKLATSQKWTPAFQGESSVNKNNILMVGNPGAGKSSLLNGIAGKFLFEAGNRRGIGKTSVLAKEVLNDGTILIDTPGVEDIKKWEQVAQEICKALEAGGVFKVCFVCTLERGRAKPSDLAFFQLVLDAVLKIQSNYGIIIHKAEKQDVREFESNCDNFISVIGFNQLSYRPTSFYVFRDMQSFRGASNKIPTLPYCFQQFIDKLPEVVIDPVQVSELKILELGDLIRKLESELQESRQSAHANEARLRDELHSTKQSIARLERNVESFTAERERMEEDRHRRESLEGHIHAERVRLVEERSRREALERDVKSLSAERERLEESLSRQGVLENHIHAERMILVEERSRREDLERNVESLNAERERLGEDSHRREVLARDERNKREALERHVHAEQERLEQERKRRDVLERDERNRREALERNVELLNAERERLEEERKRREVLVRDERNRREALERNVESLSAERERLKEDCLIREALKRDERKKRKALENTVESLTFAWERNAYNVKRTLEQERNGREDVERRLQEDRQALERSQCVLS